MRVLKSKEIDFIQSRLSEKSENKYTSLPLEEKLRILTDYWTIDSETSYCIANYARTFFSKNPDKTSTLHHGEISQHDFAKRPNPKKLLDYIATNYPSKKAHSLLDQWLTSNGETIAREEYRDTI